MTASASGYALEVINLKKAFGGLSSRKTFRSRYGRANGA